jgi:parvulin-like peptidyl-prolyl isomerase
MRSNFSLAVLFAATVTFPALAGTLPPETAVIEDGPITVDAGDIEGYMLRIPAERRTEFRGSRDRIAGIADTLFVARSLAAKARALGLDKELTVQRRLQQVQDGLLADIYMQHLEKTAPAVNLEARARELYVANQAQYVVPEQVNVQHILIGLSGRTREMAEERARKVYEEVKSGKEEFLALAARLSDDPDKKRNGGDLGYSAPSSFVEPVAKRIAAMSRKGEISEPIESHLGFHIVKFIDRQKPRTRTYEEMKRVLIQEEKDRLAKKRTEELITQLRSSPTATVHIDKLEALVTPIDDVLSKAAAAEAAKAAAEASKAR